MKIEVIKRALNEAKGAVSDWFFYHTVWPNLNYRYVNDLARRAKAENLRNGKLLFQFVASSCSILDGICSPGKSRKKRIVKIMYASLTREQVHEVHQVLIWALVGIFVKLNPLYRGTIEEGCEGLIGTSSQSHSVYEGIIKIPQFDLGHVCATIWPVISGIIRPMSQTDLDWVRLVPLIHENYLRAIKNINQQS